MPIALYINMNNFTSLFENLTPEQIGTAEGYRLLEPDEVMDGGYYPAMHEVDKLISGSWYNKVWPNDKNGIYRTKLSKRDLHFRMGRPIATAP